MSELLKLTLNVSNNKGTLEALKREKDSRVKGYPTRMNSLRKLAISKEPGFVSVGPANAELEDQEFSLADYIGWLKEDERFPGVTPPPELLALNPERPYSLRTARVGSSEPSTPPEPARSERSAKSAETNVKNTLLKMLLGLAVSKYDYKLGDRSRGANTEAIEKLSSDLGACKFQVSTDTVRTRLIEAEDVARGAGWGETD